MSSSTSLISIQKSRSKRTVLPKASLIKIFLDNSPLNKSHLLPKLNNQDVVTQFNLLQNFENASNDGIKHVRNSSNPNLLKTTSPSSSFTTITSPNNIHLKKTLKDNKFKQITRLCLYHENEHAHQTYYNDQTNNDLNDTLEDLNQSSLNQYRNKQNLLKHLSKEFLVDCRQRLDFNTFKKLLEILNSHKQSNSVKLDSFDSNLQFLEGIHSLIKNDINLCNKFSAFMTGEYAIHFNLFMQSSQYEKTYNFLQKLEIFIPNKCTFKKLIQSVSASCNLSLESDTFKAKIEDIKLKINSSTKQNELIYDELNYLFDQRCANLEPAFERVSLVDVKNDQHNDNIHEEFIDLTNVHCLNIKNKSVNKKIKLKNNDKSEKLSKINKIK